MKPKKLLFSVTAKDFNWDYFNGSGNGGQNRNKTQACVRCTHPPSGAQGVSQESRSQSDNKVKAFKRCIETKEFKAWHKLECARRTGMEAEVEQAVERQLQDVKIETKDENGRWKPTKEEDLGNESE